MTVHQTIANPPLMSVLIKAPFLRPYPLGLSQKPIALLPITGGLALPFTEVELILISWIEVHVSLSSGQIITNFTCLFERTDNG